MKTSGEIKAKTEETKPKKVRASKNNVLKVEENVESSTSVDSIEEEKQVFVIPTFEETTESIFFADVEKVKSKDLNPELDYCSYNDHKIIVHLNGRKKEVNSVSKDYLLVPNNEIFPKLEEEMQKFGPIHIIREVKNSSSFFSTYRFDDPSNRASIMKNDILIPKLTIQNSYNSRNLYGLEFGMHRLICENGLSIQEESESDYNFKLSHCESNLDKIIEQTLEATSSFLDQFKIIAASTFTPLIAQKVKQSDVEDAVNQILVGTHSLLSYKKEIVERIFLENQTKGVEINLFSIYNGINFFLQPHNNEKMTSSIDVREKTDKRLLAYISNMVKSA